MRKKITRIIVFIVLLFTALLIALPYLMENKVGQLLKANVNNNIKGDFDFSAMTLSLYRDFPNANVSLDQISLVNIEPFMGDTLFKASKIHLKMGIAEFFEGTNDPIEIKEIRIDSAMGKVIINTLGEANYDIGINSENNSADDEQKGNTTLSIRSYEITNGELTYLDQESNYLLVVEGLNHSGAGDLSEVESELRTKTKALVSFTKEETKYLDRNSLDLDASIGIDLENNRYTFKENKVVLNRLPLVFDGYVELKDKEQEMDFRFNTIASDFKNFLALIPEKYSKDISQLKTRGNFDLAGHIHGILNENSIPEFKIQINAEDASFQYPELPKKIEHIYIDAIVENSTGRSEDTSVNIEKAAFQIDKDTFEIQAMITKILGKAEVNSHAKGSINFDNLSQAYPVPPSVDLSGRLTADINTAFTLIDIENQDYQKIALSGVLNVTGLNYPFESLPHPLKIHTLNAELGPKKIEISEIAGITGSTDFSAVGELQNTLGFLFNDGVLKGNFEMKSNSFVIEDLMVEGSDNESETAEEETFKIPTYLDLNLNALVGKAVYDNVVMYDLVGNLRIKDEVITFSEISSRMLDGRIVFDGLVSTKDEKPSFRMALDMTRLNIGNTFKSIELMQLLSPAAKALDGRFSTKIVLAGNLTDQLDLDINSISGDVLAEILTAEISPDRVPVTKLLDNTLGFVVLDKLDLSGLKTAFSFKDGQVQVKPFRVKYEDISLELSGGHSFANALDYELTLDVPARYMGDDVNKLLAGIGDESLEDITVPVIANIAGSYKEPKISTDLKSQVRAVTNQLVEIQKQKYINQGKKEVNKLIGNVLTGNDENDPNSEDNDNTSVQTADILEKTLQNNSDSSKKISTKGSDDKAVKETAKSILGGLLKSKSITSKDTLN